jgi:general secretion pathway protein G
MALLRRCDEKARVEGMTFIELTIMLLIIGILVTIVAPGAWQWLSKTRQYKTESMVKGIKLAVTQFHSDTGQYPNTLYDLAFRPADPKLSQRWRGEYVSEKDIEQDGWGHELVYTKNPTGQGKRPYELYSWGASGEGSPKEEWLDVWNL